MNRVAYVVTVLFLASMLAKPQMSATPRKANFCDVVASPAEYNGKTLSVEVILSPSDHSLALYCSACMPTKDFNVTTQAVLAASWEASPNGKKLKAILKHQRNAQVTLDGIFESDSGPYGPDVARFRFVISRVNSVAKAAPR